MPSAIPDASIGSFCSEASELLNSGRMDVKPKTKMSNSRFGHQLSVKDLLESAGGLTFRKTFTPSVPHVSTLPTDSTSSSTTFGSSKTADGEKATIFSRLCELFGKEAQYMHEVYKSDNPASAAADVLGYSYEAPTKNTRKKEQAKQAKPEKQQVTPPPPPLPPLKIKPIEVQDVKNKVVEQKAPVTDERQVVRDRLMKDLKEKIAQRRIEIKMQRQELFKNPMGIDLSLEEEDQGQNDLWTAIPALADPDNLDSSFETEEHHSQSGAEPSFRGEMEENREWPFATEMCIQMEVSDASSQPPSSPSEGSEFHAVDLNRSADSRLPLQIFGGPWDPDAAFSCLVLFGFHSGIEVVGSTVAPQATTTASTPFNHRPASSIIQLKWRTFVRSIRVDGFHSGQGTERWKREIRPLPCRFLIIICLGLKILCATVSSLTVK